MTFSLPYIKCNILVVAALGFLLVGIAAVGCIVFGIVEIASGDAIFRNQGLGEVLTVLGTYFTIPYLFILGSAVVISNRLSCLNFLQKDFGLLPQHAMLGATIVAFILQQVVTNLYMTILQGNATLGFIAWDIIVFGFFCYFRLSAPWPGIMYTVMYVAKLGVQWNYIYETINQPFWGPNGVLAMLFLCIPIIQLPLYVSGATANEECYIVEAFTNKFNLYLSHLLHSLDMMSIYRFSFLAPETTATYVECPAPLKTLLMVLIAVCFLGNNITILHLFYRRTGETEAEVPFLPKILADASRRVEREAAAQTNNSDENASHQRRIFQYFLCMLVVCDIPMLIMRLELWRKRYWKLDIFVAKNLKNIVDVLMLLMRTDRSRESVVGVAASPGRPGALLSPAVGRR